MSGGMVGSPAFMKQFDAGTFGGPPDLQKDKMKKQMLGGMFQKMMEGMGGEMPQMHDITQMVNPSAAPYIGMTEGSQPQPPMGPPQGMPMGMPQQPMFGGQGMPQGMPQGLPQMPWMNQQPRGY